MKWVGFLFIMWFFCFSLWVKAQVVCASPQGEGDTTTEGVNINEICNPGSTNDSRDVNVANVVYQVTADTAAPDSSTSKIPHTDPTEPSAVR